MGASRVSRRLAALVAGVLLAAGCGGGTSTTTPATDTGTPATLEYGTPERPATLGYEVVASHPHDVTAFTQGLIRDGERFYESTGMLGQSDVRIVDIRTGRVLKRRALPDAEFGEGLALHDGRLFQLTWKNGIGHVYDAATLAPRGDWRYPGEGWGLTTVDDELVQSDGTATLRVLDPETRRQTRTITVRLEGRPLTGLNELEYMDDGTVWANIWPTPRMVVIDLASGAVVATMDLTGLKAQQTAGAETNGIARNAEAGTVYLTGKYWDTVYEVRVRPTDAD